MIEIDLWFELLADWVTISTNPKRLFVTHFENWKENVTHQLEKVIGDYFHFKIGPERVYCVANVDITMHKVNKLRSRS